MSINGTPGCSSEKLFFELWLALEVGPSMSARVQRRPPDRRASSRGDGGSQMNQVLGYELT